MQVYVPDKWQTEDFNTGLPGPVIPRGTHEAKVTTGTKTGRRAVVLAHPEWYYGKPTDLWGEDEEHLHLGQNGATIIEEVAASPT